MERDNFIKMAEPCKIMVMASGFGSNFQALIDAVPGALSNSRIISLIVNRKSAHATVRAEKAGTLYFTAAEMFPSLPRVGDAIRCI